VSAGWVGDFRARQAAIGARLEAARPGPEREAVKREIVAFFKEVDAALGDLGQVKEGIRALVDRYKQLQADAEPGGGLQPGGGRPPVHADHLGASTYIEKGWSLIALGDHAGAIQTLRRALELSPEAAEAQSLLGWALMLQGDHDEALATFSQVLMREPSNALARVNLGYLCLRKGIFGEAIEHLSRAIRLDNDRKATLYAHYYLGLVYLEREMYEDAQSFFRKTLTLGPNLIEAYYDMGRAQWFVGNKDGARRTWTEGHKANKFNPWAKRCREMLDLVAAGGEVPRSLPS
jgi:tetratricopeptide (TPR) repeat protein